MNCNTTHYRANSSSVPGDPTGIYRAAGDDQWVAVAITDDDQWRALCSLLGEGGGASTNGLADLSDLAGLTASERRGRRRQLDELVERWTSARPPAEAQERLQAVGVPAHQVQNTREAWEDPQLRHRGHFQQVEHSAMGTTWVEGPRLRLSRTPGQVHGSPALGEHSWQVLTELLGYDEERAATLAAAGIFE